MSTVADTRHGELSLSKEEQLEHTDDLVARAHNHSDPIWEAAWLEECNRRMEAIDSGRCKAIPWSEIKAELDARFGRK